MLKNIKRDLILYQLAHQNKWNMVCHYFAFLFAFLAWIIIWFNVVYALGLAVLHYCFAWVGHYYFEKNKPASFKKPFLGFYAGFLWFFIKTAEVMVGKRLLPSVDDSQRKNFSLKV